MFFETLKSTHNNGAIQCYEKPMRGGIVPKQYQGVRKKTSKRKKAMRGAAIRNRVKLALCERIFWVHESFELESAKVLERLRG